MSSSPAGPDADCLDDEEIVGEEELNDAPGARSSALAALQQRQEQQQQDASQQLTP